MEITNLSIAGLKRIRPTVYRDQRGFFFESYNEKRYLSAGIDCRFMQDNHSFSVKGTLRGLHYQSEPGQAKLIRVGRGRIFDVAVDLRPGSATFGKWEGVYLDAESHEQFFIPVGFAHGYCVVSEQAEVLYKTSSLYNPATECSLKWNDPEIGVSWPISDPILAERDLGAESFADYRRRIAP
ncbi:MAG: dTDP-4-dehydrorhamnose 3,5-epimerase [Deltaproteobacteria bacterium]|nr:dTDP-4-dehydrorhamnose 3,5-epimerase [Deltaproteobacteria bacterium]